MADLRDLADRFVKLSAELDGVRAEIKRCVLNGADPTPNPTRPPRSGGKTSARAARSQAADERALALIQSEPMSTSAIARAMGAKVNTTTERMKRLLANHRVERDAAGMWSATP